jgi:hypothetical protein
VHVQGEGRLAPSDAAHGPVHELITAGRRDLLVLGHRARMHARHRGREPEVARVAAQPLAQTAELGDRPADRGMRARRQLERRPVGLGRAARLEISAEHRQQLVRALRQPPALGIEQHHLLLQTDRVRRRRPPIRPFARVRRSGQSDRCWPP